MPVSSSVEEYIAGHHGETKKRLVQIREIIADAMPHAEQKISWGMPTFKLGRYNTFNFAAFKNHISLFPSSYLIEHFEKELEPYKTSNGTIQFQNNEPLPVELLRKIVIWRKQFMINNPDKG